MQIKLPRSKSADARQHHVIISGTGRSGTTFLVQLLTELGLDTGFPDPNAQIREDRGHAGMEWTLRNNPTAPYIVKNPNLCEHLPGILKNEDVAIDHAIIPIRDLYSAAESRRTVARKGRPGFLMPRRFLGIRKWRIRRPEEQESVLAQNFFRLVHTIAEHNIPMTLLFFRDWPKIRNTSSTKSIFFCTASRTKHFPRLFKKSAAPNSFTTSPPPLPCPQPRKCLPGVPAEPSVRSRSARIFANVQSCRQHVWFSV